MTCPAPRFRAAPQHAIEAVSMLDPSIVGQRHYDIARSTQKMLQDYKSLQDIIAILGMDELSEEDKLTVHKLKV